MRRSLTVAPSVEVGLPVCFFGGGTKTNTWTESKPVTVNVQKFRPVKRSRDVTHYRTVSKTRQVTKYRTVQRTREVTRYRSAARMVEKTVEYRVPLKDFYHQALHQILEEVRGTFSSTASAADLDGGP